MIIPQIIWVALTLISLVDYASNHGQERGKYNFWDGFLATSISMGLLYWGGFFS